MKITGVSNLVPISQTDAGNETQTYEGAT